MRDDAGSGSRLSGPEEKTRDTLEPGQGKVRGSRGGKGLSIRIGWKITTIVVLVMFLLAVVNIFFTRNRFEKAMNGEFESKAGAIAVTIAKMSEDKLVSRDYGPIQSLIDGYKDVHGVVYILVRDAEGGLAAGVFEKGYSDKLTGLNPLTGQEELKLARFEVEGVGNILEVAVPVLFGAAGAVRVGMDYDVIRGELNQITEKLITQFAVASILGILLLHGFVAFLLRHMRTILDVLERVKSGDLTARVSITTRDEFLDLAAHLNDTLTQLSAIVEKVDQSYHNMVQASESISRVYQDVREGMDQQGGLASDTFDSVTNIKKIIDDVTGGIHVLENSTNDSFSSIMEMGASIEEVSSMADFLLNAVTESNTAIREVSISIEKVAENLSSLSGASEETAGAMNEMSASIFQVRGNAESTAQDAIQMSRLAEEGAEISRKAREGMRVIKESSAQVSETMSLVALRIEEIDEILRFIADITGKTNLLALNAAIIAAQAGTQGKGFGVVADEINELAQNTKAQTNRISEVIEGLRGEVFRAGEAAEDSERKVDEGVSLTEEVTGALEGIMDSTMLVSHKIEEIAHTTSEQAETSNRVLETTQRLTESVANIKSLGEQQTEAAGKVVQMSTQVQETSQKVRTSTEEQTVTSQQINKELTRITDTVRNIAESTEIQSVNGAKVLQVTEDLMGVIRNNRQTVDGLQGVIDEMNQRLEDLQRDLEVFKTKQNRSS